MIWTRKYTPKSFSSLFYRNSIKDILESYTIDTLPNLIFYGNPGFGKRTILQCLIGHLYKKTPKFQHVRTEIKSSTGVDMEIEFLESPEVIDVTPSNYNMQDKTVIQTLIKEAAQTRSVLGFFGSEERKIKLIVLNEAEKLTKEAQGALRRTVETYSSNFRIVLICNDLSGIIDPLKSRSMLLRVGSLKNEELQSIAQHINEKEEVGMTTTQIEKLVYSSKGNLRRIISFLELEKIYKEGNKSLPKNFLLDWEELCLNIVDLIFKRQDTTTIISIRDILYEILTFTIPAEDILSYLSEQLIKKVSLDQKIKIAKYASIYSERIVSGNKEIFHLEAFIVSVMCLLKKNKGN